MRYRLAAAGGGPGQVERGFVRGHDYGTCHPLAAFVDVGRNGGLYAPGRERVAHPRFVHLDHGMPVPGTSVVKFARSVARGFGAAVAGRASTTAAASIVRTTVANNRLDFKVITPPLVGDPLHTTHTLNVL